MFCLRIVPRLRLTSILPILSEQKVQAMKANAISIIAAILLTLFERPALADIDSQLQSLDKRVNQLEMKERQLLSIAHSETGDAALFLFGAFCALWAQNTNRNAWLWFFVGVLFNVITVIVLLVKNSNDRRRVRNRVVRPAPQF
jgi:hypothetical protein